MNKISTQELIIILENLHDDLCQHDEEEIRCVINRLSELDAENAKLRKALDDLTSVPAIIIATDAYYGPLGRSMWIYKRVQNELMLDLKNAITAARAHVMTGIK